MRRQGGQIKSLRRLAAFFQVNAENHLAHRRRWQIHKEDFVQAPLADQFRWQALDIVGRGHQEHLALVFRHPGEQGTEHPPGGAAIVVAHGDALLDLIDPQHTRGHGFRQLQGLAHVALGFAEELVVDRPHVHAQQWQPPQSGYGFGSQAFAAALHAHHHDAPWTVDIGLPVKRLLSFAQPVFQTLQAAHVGKAFRVVLIAEHAVHFHQGKLGLVDLRQVRLGNGTVMDNRPPGQLAGIFHAQATQVAHQSIE